MGIVHCMDCLWLWVVPASMGKGGCAGPPPALPAATTGVCSCIDVPLRHVSIDACLTRTWAANLALALVVKVSAHPACLGWL